MPDETAQDTPAARREVKPMIATVEPLTNAEQDDIARELDARRDGNPFAGWSNREMARAMATIVELKLRILQLKNPAMTGDAEVAPQTLAGRPRARRVGA